MRGNRLYGSDGGESQLNAISLPLSKVTFDFVTSSLNPNFPARVGIVPGLANTDHGYDKRSWLSITGIVTHDAGGTPQDVLDSFASLYEGPAPKSLDGANGRITAWFSAAVQRWCAGQSRPGDRQVIDWLLTHRLLPNQAKADSPLAALLTEYRRVEQQIAFPRAVNSMDERESAKSGLYLNVRGNFDALGELVQPDFLQMFAGRNSVAQSTGSGRLELAESLVHPEHPLTSRVYVNRVWQWVFGTGLVTPPDDFGRLGDKPSHPELLDWLARDFMLAVSGRLDAKLYGRPLNPSRPAEDILLEQAANTEAATGYRSPRCCGHGGTRSLLTPKRLDDQGTDSADL